MLVFLSMRTKANLHRRNVPKIRGKPEKASPDRARAVARASDDLNQAFPPIRLPIAPPYPPEEAKNVPEIPRSKSSAHPEWLYEPKWDGFRCLA